MKKIVFTCITNEIDKLEDPPKDPSVDYICFTDGFIDSNVWKILPLLKKFDCPRLTSRFHKTIGMNEIEADIVLWQDGKVKFKDYHSKLFKEGIWLFKHPIRNCLYEEATRVIHLKKDISKKVKNQISRYKKEGFNENQGLYETSILIRDKNYFKFNELWWDEIKKESIRDQISLPYILWKLNMKPNIIQIDYNNNNLFKVKEHHFIDYFKRIPLI